MSPLYPDDDPSQPRLRAAPRDGLDDAPTENHASSAFSQAELRQIVLDLMG